ncbi:MAG TPA: GNAT family N-acetyltransferase [Novosphingobium sp.]|nr:GNAT family N-acetyltransferase [Novosphingobium sp.]
MLRLRAPTPVDIPALAALGRASFSEAFGHLYRPEDLAAFLDEVHDEGAVARRLGDPARVYALADVNRALAGYCQLVLTDQFDHPTDAAFGITLSQLYCAGGHTGSGVGGALMDWALAEARARGADEMRLSVWSGNFGAQRFYARYGFEHVADIDFWVGSQRDDEFLYSLKL